MAYFVITHPYTGTPFVINLQDSAAIAHARAILAGTAVDNLSVGGRVTFAPVDYNIGWSFHIAPEDVVFGDAWITVIDDNFIPGATLVAELNEISGTAGSDAMAGGDLADIIFGKAGDDHIFGGAGDDHLI